MARGDGRGDAATHQGGRGLASSALAMRGLAGADHPVVNAEGLAARLIDDSCHGW
ncbi:hypothetical protein [Alloactinosynnema sp. L-07]|nr:hypothetical protein [Alloactinosynnema sp. L-07]